MMYPGTEELLNSLVSARLNENEKEFRDAAILLAQHWERSVLVPSDIASLNKYQRMDLIRERIAALPGKTVQRWSDSDDRCHCTHCYLCGELYRTADIGVHENECQTALLTVLGEPRT